MAGSFIKARATDPGKPLVHFWSNCVGAGRANEGLRASWQKQLSRAVQECGFKYLRFHGLFHDDMFVYREENNKPVYNWQYIDDLFDAMLDMGIRPFVELGFSPKAMASSNETLMWWNTCTVPPKDYDKWAELVKEFIRHCQARYGQEELRRWYFEVWNEPNLDAFFHSTKSKYFELYKITSLAIKAVDPELRVGGPATSNFVPDTRFDGETEDRKIASLSLNKDPDTLSWRPVWVEQFLEWCKKNKLPVDFISTHPYPTDFALDGHGVFRGVSRKKEAVVEDMRLLKKIVLNSGYPKAEIHCTEWSSSPSSRDHAHDFPQAGTYAVFANLEGAGLIDSLSWWAFTDIFEEGGAGDSVWHGGFGLLNFQGIDKPAYNAYKFLHQLGTEIISQSPGYIVTRHPSGHLTSILYNYPDEVPASAPMAKIPEEARTILRQGKPREVKFNLSGLPSRASFAVETMDADSGWARGVWEQIGSPEPPTRVQVEYLKQASQPRLSFCTATAEGVLDLKLTLNPWAVVLINQIELR